MHINFYPFPQFPHFPPFSTMLNSATTATRTRSPFTQTQWQELEHQALIYKYLVTGTPIPSELIFSVKRSLESSLASRIFPHQSIGWGCFQVGYGRKPDPEPGRCRRTDGKKWRCSKEAYPDSKYCEKHMHRGRNRSRKPVEQLTSSTQTQTSLSNLNPVSLNRNPNPNPYPVSSPSANSPYPFSPLSSSSSPVESDLFQSSSIRSSPYPYPNCSNSSSASTHRYFNGMREGSDERPFFPESSRTIQDPYNITSNLPMNATSYKSFNQSQLEALAAEATSKQQQQQDNDHCFILGTDFKSTPTKLEKEAETQKSLHHFFGESWLDLSSSSTSRQQTDG